MPHPPKTELTIQVLTELSKTPSSATELATKLGTKRTHIINRLGALTRSGEISMNKNNFHRNKMIPVYRIEAKGLETLSKYNPQSER